MLHVLTATTTGSSVEKISVCVFLFHETMLSIQALIDLSGASCPLASILQNVPAVMFV